MKLNIKGSPSNMELNINFAKGTTYLADEWSLSEAQPHALLTQKEAQKEEFKAQTEDLTTKKGDYDNMRTKGGIRKMARDHLFPSSIISPSSFPPISSYTIHLLL